MDLFTKADKQKEFPDSNTVLIHLKSNGKFNVTIHDNFLTVEPRGFTNAVNKGLIGQKTYDLNNVSGVQYKKPGFTTGYLQIVLIGGRDARNGVSGAVKDENSITFSKKEDHLILEIKEYIENNPDEFEDLFIANNTSQFEKLFPKTYVETLKEQAVSRFKNENVMEAVRYGLAYPDNMKSAMTRQFVNNDKYKTLLVFNNNKNILGLTPENIIKETKEELERKPEKVQDDIQKTEVETAKNNKDMSIFIKLSGKEKESYKGIYLPIDSGTQVFIPKQLYRIDDGRLQILNSQSKSANMSEYAVDENTRTKKFMNRLTLDNFYHKYFNLYEISMEKEVIPSASY